ncbi:MAG: hypothetical protein JWL71_391 [Acidobacteria bacterium]|nr:hypothetical protein [Acidobacteriota bacterium]
MNARFLAIARDPSIIPGVHHYCDEWCHYCPVTRRCLGFRCTDEFRRQRGRRGGDATFASIEEAIAFTRELAALDGSPTEDLDAILANLPRRSGRETADPLAALAWDYAVTAAFLFTAETMAIIGEGPRASGPVPVETVLWYHLRIYMKLVRALISLARVHEGAHRVEDANGCAKLTLVSIARSRTALAALRTAVNARAIDPLIATLTALEQGIDERLPGARRFLRVGLDCPAA